MNEKQLDLAPLEDRILFDVAPLDAQAMEPAIDSFEIDSEVDLFNWAEEPHSNDSLFVDSQGPILNAEETVEHQLDGIDALLEAEIDSDVAISIATEYKQLIVVDQGVDNYMDLIDAAIGTNPPENFEIMLVDSSESALQRINERLSETSYSAIHLVAHGGDGELFLGNEVWNQGFIAENASGFTAWNHNLSEGADLLIYGCDVAESEHGVAFVEELSELTGTDVAASTDLTGTAELGGDWDLELQIGSIEHSVLFDAVTDSYWAGLLNVATAAGDSVTTVGLNGGTTDAVAIAADGDYVVTWTQETTSDGAEVYAQMFNADGTEKASAFLVNETAVGDQEFASVASDANGNFVIVWSDTTADEVFMKRYASDGTVLADENRVDDKAKGITVAMNDSGQFVAAWEEVNNEQKIKAETYDVDGSKIKNKFTVNSNEDENVGDVAVDMNSSGDFAVSWTRDAYRDDIYAASFDIDGNANFSGDVEVANINFVGLSHSDVSINDSGDLAVSFTSSSGSRFANVRMVNSDGTLGNYYGPVSDITSGDQTNTSIKLANNGDFVVTWEGNGAGDSDGIHGKTYDASLDQFSAEITENLYTSGDQSNASFDFNDAGDFVLVYSGDGPNGSTIFVSNSLIPNSPPTGSDSTIQTGENVLTTISIVDFGYSDKDGDPLTKVRIASLPSDGTLRLNGVAVSLDDEISASDLSSNQLTFEPNAGFAGEASFTFQVYEENNSAIETNTLTINVHEDIAITIDEDSNHTFSATDFSSVLTIDHVKIISLPQNGTLTLSGTAVTVDQTISKSELDAGNLVFAPEENRFGTPYDSFEFRIFDGAEYSDEQSTVSILQTDFSSDSSGFTYADDVFGTSQPDEVSGSYDGAAGNGGGGALVVDLGPHDTGNAVSGGWTQSINLAQDSVVRITVQHRTQFAGETEDGEYVEAVLEVNGVRYGSSADSSLNRINGANGDTADHDSGWQTSVIEIELDAGANSITLGGYNNSATANNEWGKVSFDNVEIESLTFSDFEINVNSVNDRPTDIALDNLSVNENASGAIVGNLIATDPDVGDSLTLTVDHSDFEIVGGQLKLKDGVSLDHEAGDTVSVQVTAEDSGGLQRIESFTITVNDINETPTAFTFTNQAGDENVAGAVLGAFSVTDPDDGDSHSVNLNDNRFEIVGGNLRLKAGESLDHEVDDGMTLSVTATDVGGLSLSQDFTITVNNVNESPTDITLNYLRINENSVGGNVGTITVADPDIGDSHTYLLSDNRFEIAGNQLKLKAGEVLDHEVEDEVHLTITATDVAGASVGVDFTISVDDLNESPYAISLDNLVVDENAVNANIGSISSTDHDDGDTVTYTVSDNRFEIINGSLLRLKSGQSLDFEVDPTVSITVTATDSGSLSSSENFTITVSDIDETATAHAFGNSYSVIEDNSVAGNLINDNTGSGLDYGFGTLELTTTPVVSPTNGTVVLQPDGSFSYSPDLDFTGNDSFQYEIKDANGAVSTATVDITVTPVNDAPEITGMTNLIIDENSNDNTLVGIVQIDDPDFGDTFTYSLTDSADSRFSINSDGELRVADGSRLDFEDLQSHSIEVQVEDSAGAIRTETFTIAVVNVNELPNAVNDTAIVTEEQSVIISVADLMSNDSDPDGFGTISFDSVGPVANGTLTDNGNNTFTYTPNENFFGNDSFQYTIRDAGGLTSSATVSITVNPVNDTPVAADDSFSLMEGETLVMTGSVFSNDVDYDGDTLTGNLLVGPQHGTLEWNTDGTFRYAHDGSETTSDQFTYSLLDPSGESDTATVNLSVAPVNDAPVAVGETTTVEGNESAEVEVASLLRNDSDAEGSDLSFEIVGQPANGTVVIENGRLVYTPDPGFNGLEQIFYRVSDGELFSETVAININVNFTNLETETSAAFARSEEVVVEEEVVISESVEEVEAEAEIVEFSAIIEPEDDDEANLEQLGRLAQAQGAENELELRAGSDDEDEESYRFSSNLKSSSAFNNDLETYSRYRVASDRESEGFSTSTFDIQTAEQFDFSHLSQDLDNFDHTFEIDGSVDQVTFATLSSITGALTVGYVLWMVRGGMLMASFVSSIPAWQSVDPLNIVEFGSIGGGDADEESLESIVTQFSSPA